MGKTPLLCAVCTHLCLGNRLTMPIMIVPYECIWHLILFSCVATGSHFHPQNIHKRQQQQHGQPQQNSKNERPCEHFNFKVQCNNNVCHSHGMEKNFHIFITMKIVTWKFSESCNIISNMIFYLMANETEQIHNIFAGFFLSVSVSLIFFCSKYNVK